MLTKNSTRILFCLISLFLLGFNAFAANAQTTEQEPTVQITEEPLEATTQIATEKTSEIWDDNLNWFLTLTGKSYTKPEGDLDWIGGLSGEPYTGPKCYWFAACEEMCKDIYSRRFVREDCEKLHPDTVKKLHKIDETFENPTLGDLESMDVADFEAYVEINSRPLKKHISKFSSLEAKRVLIWIAGRPDIVEIFQQEDDEFELLKGLLGQLNADMKKAFTANLSTSEEVMFSFMELIVKKNNEEALDWVYYFFQEECDNSYPKGLCIFQEWYCQTDLNEVFWQDKPEEDEEELKDYKKKLKDYVHNPSLFAIEELLNKMSNDPDSISKWWGQIKEYRERLNDYWYNLAKFEIIEELVDEILEDYTTDSTPSWWDEDTETNDLYADELMSLCSRNLVKN